MATSEANAPLLAIGKQCSHSSCNLVDFLPFKCQHCSESFCQEHFMVDAHKCPQYDESKHNRVAPDCPFCNTPVAIRPGQDPNVRMEEHFMKDCSVMTGKTGRARSMPVCDKLGCKKALFSPIRCEKCRKQFCPTHRFPSDHTCSAPAPASARAGPKPASSNLLNNLNTNAKALNAKASAAGTTALGALKKNISAASSAPAPASTKAGTSTPRPFSKVDSPSASVSTSNNESHDKYTPPTNTSNGIASTPSHIITPTPPAFTPFKFNSFKPRSIFVSA